MLPRAPVSWEGTAWAGTFAVPTARAGGGPILPPAPSGPVRARQPSRPRVGGDLHYLRQPRPPPVRAVPEGPSLRFGVRSFRDRHREWTADAMTRVRPILALAALVAGGTVCPGVNPGDAGKYFTIKVVDGATGRGVPLVELRTVHGVRYYTDSNGLVAFHEPGLGGRDVFFQVAGHGYEFPKDGFG